MIVLFTDFGSSGPYIGQMEAIIYQYAPAIKIIRLVDNAPTGNPVLSSYLLAAFSHSFPKGTVFLSVVDPGVGGDRMPVVLKANEQYFVGPENGLFNSIAVQSVRPLWYKIVWQPENCSSSFHGRDIFAPVAAMLTQGQVNKIIEPYPEVVSDQWLPDLNKVIYFDYYGNAMTGLRYQDDMKNKRLKVANFILERAETFCNVKLHQPFWYCNSSGLVEIAVNKGNAQAQLKLELGIMVNLF